MASKTISTILNLKDNFSETIKRTTSNTASFAKEIKQSETTVGKMKNSVVNAFSSIGESIKDGIGLGAGLDIYGTVKEDISDMINFGSDLQKSLNGIQAATGYNSDAMSGMKDVMLGIYNDNFGENFEEIGETIKTIGQQTGATGSNLKELAENGLLLKDTFGFEINESIRATNAMMKQFGLNGNEAYNLITQGAQKGLNQNGDLTDQLAEYSVYWADMGFSAEEAFNALSNGVENGVFQVDFLNDAIKEFGIRSKDGSKSTMGAFQDLGLNADELTRKFANGGNGAKEAFDEVSKAWIGLDDAVLQNQIGVAIYGTKWEDVGMDAIKALTNTQGEISTTTDALKEINAIKYNDLGSAFEGIKRNIQTSVLIPISDSVLPKLNEFGGWFSNNVPSIKEKVSGITDFFIDIGSTIIDKDLPPLQDFIDSCTNLGTTILNSVKPAIDKIVPDNWDSVANSIKDILTNATDVVNFINDNWNEIEPIVSTIVGALGAYKLALMAIETWTVIVGVTTGIYEAIELAIWGVTAATSGWEAAQWLLNVAMDANPIGVVIGLIAAIGLIIYEVITHWQDICTWVGNTWDMLKDNPIAEFIALTNPFTAVLFEIAKHFDDITGAISKAWKWLTDWNDTDTKNKDINVTEHKETVTDGAAVTITSNGGSNDTGHNATGTQYWKGGRTVVGEYGPEVVNLPGGSKVYTASQSKGMLGGNNPIHVEVIVQGNIIGNEEYADSIGQHIVNKLKVGLINQP